MKETRDILTLFEALNNHEVFTPPRLAREMLNLLPAEIWTNPDLKFLDPCAKSGVFLREAFYRLYDGLKGKGKHIGCDGRTYDLDEHKQRINHILKNMLFGIATSELTGYVSRRTLYGVMEANTDKQIAAIDSFERSTNFHEWTEEERLNFIGRNKFNEYYDYTLFNTQEYIGFENEGNIFYPNDEVAKKVVEGGSYEIEDTYFPFIDDSTHHQKIIDIKEGKMKFDVIIGNPPYQQADGGAGASAKPIYNLFIELAKNLKPKYLTMIIPSRWFAGGKGLDSFRQNMLNDRTIKYLVDYPNAKDCFPGNSIGGGVCYFLSDRSYSGDCEITNVINKKRDKMVRPLNQYDLLVRHNKAISIIEKVQKLSSEFLSSEVFPRNPFGLSSKTRGTGKKSTQFLTLHASNGISYIAPSQLPKNRILASSYKVMISKVTSEHAGEPAKDGRFRVLSRTEVIQPEHVCTDSYLIIGQFQTEVEANNLLGYLKTSFARFLLLQAVTSINLSSDKFNFVPKLDFNKTWSDELLFKKFDLSTEEIVFINQTIRPYE
jgi:site-specific DNA-methyltransferase (adenine-specific)